MYSAPNSIGIRKEIPARRVKRKEEEEKSTILMMILISMHYMRRSMSTSTSTTQSIAANARLKQLRRTR